MSVGLKKIKEGIGAQAPGEGRFVCSRRGIGASSPSRDHRLREKKSFVKASSNTKEGGRVGFAYRRHTRRGGRLSKDLLKKTFRRTEKLNDFLCQEEGRSPQDGAKPWRVRVW